MGNMLDFHALYFLNHLQQAIRRRTFRDSREILVKCIEMQFDYPQEGCVQVDKLPFIL